MSTPASTAVHGPSARASGIATGGLWRATGGLVTGWGLIRAFTVLVYYAIANACAYRRRVTG